MDHIQSFSKESNGDSVESFVHKLKKYWAKQHQGQSEEELVHDTVYVEKEE